MFSRISEPRYTATSDQFRGVRKEGRLSGQNRQKKLQDPFRVNSFYQLARAAPKVAKGGAEHKRLTQLVWDSHNLTWESCNLPAERFLKWGTRG